VLIIFMGNLLVPREPPVLTDPQSNLVTFFGDETRAKGIAMQLNSGSFV